MLSLTGPITVKTNRYKTTEIHVDRHVEVCVKDNVISVSIYRGNIYKCESFISGTNFTTWKGVTMLLHRLINEGYIWTLRINADTIDGTIINGEIVK
jgi:hypothetical protein